MQDAPPSPRVGVIMGSRSDWETMKTAAELLTALEVPHECRVVSAHRTPDLLFEYAASASVRGASPVRTQVRAGVGPLPSKTSATCVATSAATGVAPGNSMFVSDAARCSRGL